MPTKTLTPFFVPDGATFVPNEIAQGGWGPTLGGQVIGGLLARAVESQRADTELIPVRLTVDILRRVATEPVLVSAEVVRVGRRMQSIDATMTQGGELVARASALLLRRGEQPAGRAWTTPIDMPPLPSEPDKFDESLPMFIKAYGGEATHGSGAFAWQYDGPRYAWLCEIRDLVDGEEMTPFVRAAVAVDVTASMSNFSTSGLAPPQRPTSTSRAAPSPNSGSPGAAWTAPQTLGPTGGLYGNAQWRWHPRMAPAPMASSLM